MFDLHNSEYYIYIYKFCIHWVLLTLMYLTEYKNKNKKNNSLGNGLERI